VKFFSARGLESDRVVLRGFAMAASLLGVPLRPVPFTDRTRATPAGKVRELAWLLDDEGPGGLEAAKLWEQWHDKAWREAHPDAPISLLRAYWDALQEAEKREPDYAELEFTRGQRSLTVPAHWPTDRIRAALKRL
jgi:hypothetical protein